MVATLIIVLFCFCLLSFIPILLSPLYCTVRIYSTPVCGLLIWCLFTPPTPDGYPNLGEVVLGVLFLFSAPAFLVRFIYEVFKKKFTLEYSTTTYISITSWLWWSELFMAFWIAGSISAFGFVVLSWLATVSTYPIVWHVSIAIIAILFVATYFILRGRFGRFLCLGFAVCLLSLTFFSWFYYPNHVINEAIKITGSEPFCIRSAKFHDVATSQSDLTFLTIYKGKDRHFEVLSRTHTAEWSFHQSRFDPETLVPVEFNSRSYWSSFAKLCSGGTRNLTDP